MPVFPPFALRFTGRRSIGRTAVGPYATGGTYGSPGEFRGGALAPTVFVAGRVVEPNGQGIGDALVLISGGSMTSPMMARTNQFGIFSIVDVEVGDVTSSR